MTDAENIAQINKRLKRIEVSLHIHVAIIVLGFLGVFSMEKFVKSIKK